jgi:glycosyltransferase involved in cell wall biosynthesis
LGVVRIYEPEPRLWYGGRLGTHPDRRRGWQIGKGLIHKAVTTANAWGCDRFLATDYQTYRTDFFDLAHSLGIVIGKSLILPGVLSDQELATLYRLTDAFLFPSITEGWGLVVLEAIASGLPVVTANRPPFTEFLTCEQAFLVNPESAEEIADAAILAIQNIAQPLIDRSQSLCTQYSWENSAKMHVKYYTQLGRLRCQKCTLKFNGQMVQKKLVIHRH